MNIWQRIINFIGFLGSKDEIDLNILRKYGEIKQLSLEQVFGY